MCPDGRLFRSTMAVHLGAPAPILGATQGGGERWLPHIGGLGLVVLNDGASQVTSDRLCVKRHPKLTPSRHED